MIVLLSTSDDVGAVWRWPFTGRGATPLGASARRALDDAERVARHVVPISSPRVLPDAGAARLACFPALPPAGAGAGKPPTLLDGASFGLAFALASIGERLGLDVPRDLAATGDLTPDGNIHAVAFGHKFAAARQYAPLARVLVPDDPRSAAPAVEGLAVVRVGTIAAAVGATWGDAFGRALDAHLARHAEAAAERLFEVALGDPSTFLPWPAIAHAAATVRPLVDPSRAWEVEVVEAIARRHRGEPVALPPEAWTRLAGLRRPLALRLLAHAVQGANDAAAPNWREVAARALEQLRAPGEEDEGDARVLGALGRLHAGWGEWAAAAALLERSLATWRALRRPSEMSFSACELLRVTGIAGEGPAVERAIAHAEACREHDDTSQVSRDYLDLALGRARVQRGLRGADRAQVQRGLGDLARILSGSPVRGAALRWMAIAGNDDALRALDAHAGQDERRALDALLARLARGPAPDDWRARLAGLTAAELERARSVLGPDAAPDAVAAIWRY